MTKNAKVYLAARSPSKAEVALEELKASTGKDAVFLKLDLANLSSVKAAVEEFTSKETELHVLFNNAAFAISNWRSATLLSVYTIA